MLALGFVYTVWGPVHAATPTTSSNSKVVATENTKIKQFLENESKNLTADFPYRIHLFAAGQTDKNTAGVRIAETAKQLFSDTAGLLFYYQLYNHAMRVPHWHANATEVGTVLSGKMRVTIWEGTGQAKVFTVEKYGTWMIPQAAVHSLENVGEGELTFFVAYNNPNAADRDFATAWASLPDSLLEKTLGLTPQEIGTVKKTMINRLSKYDPAAAVENADVTSPFSNNFTAVKPLFNSDLGSIKRIDGTTNPAMQAMALQQTILKPSTLRVPHWYTSGDALLFIHKGNAFFTMMDSGGKIYNSLLKEGDLIFIPVGTFHSYLNIGKDNLEVYEAFNTAKGLSEITLLNGAQHFSAGTLAGATGLSKESAQKVISNPSTGYIIPF